MKVVDKRLKGQSCLSGCLWCNTDVYPRLHWGEGGGGQGTNQVRWNAIDSNHDILFWCCLYTSLFVLFVQLFHVSLSFSRSLCLYPLLYCFLVLLISCVPDSPAVSIVNAGIGSCHPNWQHSSSHSLTLSHSLWLGRYWFLCRCLLFYTTVAAPWLLAERVETSNEMLADSFPLKRNRKKKKPNWMYRDR